MKKFLTWMSMVLIISLPTFTVAQSGLSACLDKYRHSKNRDAYCYGQIGKKAIAKSKKQFDDLYEEKKSAYIKDEKRNQLEQQKRLQEIQAQEQATTQPTPTPGPETQQVRPIRQPQATPPRRRPPPEKEPTSTIPYY